MNQWLKTFDPKIKEEKDRINPIKEWDTILSYSTDVIKNTILPKLALQFRHEHFVDYFKSDWVGNVFSLCDVEVRVLDYEIVRTPGSSPEDLLLK